jgi:hypothetical protein
MVSHSPSLVIGTVDQECTLLVNLAAIVRVVLVLTEPENIRAEKVRTLVFQDVRPLFNPDINSDACKLAYVR